MSEQVHLYNGAVLQLYYMHSVVNLLQNTAWNEDSLDECDIAFILKKSTEADNENGLPRSNPINKIFQLILPDARIMNFASPKEKKRKKETLGKRKIGLT